MLRTSLLVTMLLLSSCVGTPVVKVEDWKVVVGDGKGCDFRFKLQRQKVNCRYKF